MASWIETNSEPTSELTIGKALSLVEFAERHGSEYGVCFIQARRSSKAFEIVVLEVLVDRPQLRAIDIKKRERIAVVVRADDSHLTILALREDFPFTPHQNAVPDGVPRSLCTDDRPWPEARLTWSPADCVRRIRDWLGKAVRGELVNPAQPLEPLFYSAETKLVIPRAALEQAAAGSAVKLVGRILPEHDPKVIVASLDVAPSQGQGRMVVLPIQIPPQLMAGIHRLPSTLGGLTAMLKEFGIDLLGELRSRLAQWVKWSSSEFDSLSTHLCIVVFNVVVDPSTDRSVVDARAFFTAQTAGDVGVALGCLYAAQAGEVKGKKKYVTALPPDMSKDGRDIPFEPVDVYLDFDRIMATEVAGRFSLDLRKAVLIGAGTSGSHLAVMLAREGAYQWTIVDNDVLLPHNLARHALPRWYLGMRKAPALAGYIVELLSDTAAASAIVCDYLAPSPSESVALGQALREAEIIVDATASIAVERRLSDGARIPARRISAFFNPAGTAGILLAEDMHRQVTLRDLEARYYHLILTEMALEGHLKTIDGVRYSGSCRTLTNRIPERAASLLTGLLAGEIGVETEGARIVIFQRQVANGVREFQYDVETAAHREIEDWNVAVDAAVLSKLRTEREVRLPNETGGILLGIVDFDGKAIHVVHALAAPPDSESSPAGFERGVQGLEAEIKRVCGAVHDQIRYVGEWHSHPKGASANPSSIDVDQMCSLSLGLISEGCPAVMLIVGQTDETINLALACEVEGNRGE